MGAMYWSGISWLQNMGLPYLGQDQPGATYYFLPLNVYCFGIVDQSTQRLHAFCYHEGVAAKGGNNVASMIIGYLSMTCCLQCNENNEPICRHSLTLFMDNCSGQNKVSVHHNHN
jgi:hypothetical protein